MKTKRYHVSLLCNLQNINLSFGQKVIFNDAKLAINDGDKMGLIGLNGMGKSTLFNILASRVKPDESSPAFIFDKSSNFSLFYIPQELELDGFSELKLSNFYLSFYPKLMSIQKELSSIEHKLESGEYSDEIIQRQQELLSEFEHKGGWEIESQYLSYLKLFNLQDEINDLKSLSGGEQKKIALSIGLSAKANLVLWDEPTNHLDIETIELFEDELNSCNQAYIIISHDRYLLNHVTNRILHIEAGTINSFQGTYLEYLEYLEEKQKELEKGLDRLENKHRRELAWMRQGIKARGTRSKKRVEGFENLKGSISELKAKSKKKVNLSLEHSGRKSKQLITIKDGSFSYDDNVLLKNLNLKIAKGDKIALMGKNGVGKTTLIKILQGKEKLTSGTFKALDELNVTCFDQKRDELDPNQTPFQMIGEGQDFVHLSNGNKKHVISYLEDFLFSKDQINRPIYTLSGGEKNRLQLAYFMKRSADLWVFDEPTNDLDIETIEILEREIKNYKAAVIIIGHDRAFLDNTCDQTWLVHDKTIEHFQGGFSQVAPYLDAIALEEAIKQKEPAASSATNKKEPPKRAGLNNKEKLRLENIEDEVSKFESIVENLKEKLTSFDYSQVDKESKKQLQSLNSEIEKNETHLLKLYGEWEDLQSRQD